MISRINLLPVELRSVSKGRFYFVSASVFIAFLAVLTSVYHRKNREMKFIEPVKLELSREIELLRSREAQLLSIVPDSAVKNIDTKVLEANVALVDRIIKEKSDWVEAVHELSILVPAGLWLNTFAGSASPEGEDFVKSVRITGMSFTGGAVTDFMSSLEMSDLFESVSLAFIQRSAYQERDVYTFELSAMMRRTHDAN